MISLSLLKYYIIYDELSAFCIQKNKLVNIWVKYKSCLKLNIDGLYPSF